MAPRILQGRCTAWCMALLLLFTNAVPALSRASCTMSGHVELSMSRTDACCPGDETHEGVVLRGVCCVHVLVVAQENDYMPVVSTMLPIMPATGPAVLLRGPGATEPIIARRWNTHPPPLYASDRVASLGVLLI